MPKYLLEFSIKGDEEMILRGETDSPSVAYDMIQRVKVDINPHAKYLMSFKKVYRDGKEIDITDLDSDITEEINKIVDSTKVETDTI